MAHAIRGGEKDRHALLQSRAILFWVVFGALGISGTYAIDRTIGSSADMASLALPNDGQLEGLWASGPLQLRNQLRDREMFVEVWRTAPHREQIAVLLLDRRAKQGPIGFRHSFIDADRGIALFLDGSILMLELPAKGSQPAQRVAFRRP